MFILINLCAWFFQPVIGDTILWLTGAANYLWGTTLVLLFLLPYRLYANTQMKGIYILFSSLGMFLLGIVAGWTNENTAGAMILIALLFMLYYKRSNWKITVWSFTGFVGALIGYGFMILAPGNLERGGDAASLSLFILAFRLFNWTLTFLYGCAPLLLICFVLFIVHNRFGKGDKAGQTRISLIYGIAAVATVYAMLLAPSFPRRALFGVITYLIIAGGIWFYKLDFRQRFLRQIRLAIILFGIVYFGFTFYIAAKEINIYRNMISDREAVITQAKEAGIGVCEFDRYDGGLYIHGEDPFSQVSMSRYYGITIQFKEH